MIRSFPMMPSTWRMIVGGGLQRHSSLIPAIELARWNRILFTFKPSPPWNTPQTHLYSSSVVVNHGIKHATGDSIHHTNSDNEKNWKSSNHSQQPVRLSKLISERMGVSRREAERWIRSGEVTIAGRVIESSEMLVPLDNLKGNALKARGKVIPIDAKEYQTSSASSSSSSEASANTAQVWLVNKLRGEMVAEHDPQGRPCLMTRLSSLTKRKKLHLKAVGRLDMNTEGLMVVTTDGMYARDMERSALHRVYRVRAHGPCPPEELARRCARGVVSREGVRYAPMKVVNDEKVRNHKRTNKWFRVTCTQGKNRQVRKVFEHFGLQVTRLIRIAYGDYQLQDIPPGMALQVPLKPVSQQKRQGHLLKPTRRKEGRAKATDEERQPQGSAIQWIRHG